MTPGPMILTERGPVARREKKIEQEPERPEQQDEAQCRKLRHLLLQGHHFIGFSSSALTVPRLRKSEMNDGEATAASARPPS